MEDKTCPHCGRKTDVSNLIVMGGVIAFTVIMILLYVIFARYLRGELM